MHPDAPIIDDLVQRIVEAAHPLRIILFGSAARGEMGADSDLDVLVIMPDGTHRRKTTEEIYRHMWGFGVAKDIVVVTESDLQAYGENPSMILKNALEEGRELYHSPFAHFFRSFEDFNTLYFCRLRDFPIFGES